MIGFPRVPEVEFFLGQWLSVSDPRPGNTTGDVRQGTSIVETRGRKDWATKPSPARCTLTLDDGPEHGDGDYDPENPLGQWYGLLGRNTPMRYLLRYGKDVFTRSNQANWGASPDMGNWGTFGVGTTAASIASNTGLHSITTTSSFVATRLTDVNQRNVEVYDEFTLGAITVAGGAIEPANLMLRGHTGGDYWLLRASISTTNVLSLRIMLTGGALTVAGPVDVLTYPTTGTDIGIRFQAEGDTLRGKVWRLDTGEPLGWHLETSIVNEWLGSGWVGVRSGVASGNSNTKPVVVTHKHFRVRLPQFIGETATWETQSTVDHRDMRTNVEAASIRRRLGQGETVLETALRRYIARVEAPFGICDYWPMDQEESSTTRAANFLGGPDAKFIRGPSTGNGALKWGIDTPVLSAPKGAELSTDGRIRFDLTPGNFNTSDGYGFTWLQRVGPGCVGWFILDLDTHQLIIDLTDGLFTIRRSSKSIVELITVMTMPLSDAAQRDGTDTDWHMIGYGHRVVSGNTTYDFAVDDRLVQLTLAGTIGVPNWFAIFADSEPNSTIQVSQFVAMQRGLYNFPPGLGFPYDIIRNIYMGRTGEHAGTRFERLCLEEGVSSSMIGDPAATPAMGPQRPLSLLALTDECIDVDQGSAFDPRGALALGMRTHRATTARDALVTLDYIGQVAPEFKKTTDDQGARNDVTAKRPSGGSYRYEQSSGPRNTGDPGSDPDAVGRYDSTVSPDPNVPADIHLSNQASWRVHMGTVVGPRYPAVKVNFLAQALLSDAATTAALLDMNVDDPITVTGASARRVYDDIRLIARGYTSTVDTAYQHEIVFNCEAYAPLDVAVYGDTDDRHGTAGSELAGTLTSSATSFTVNVMAGEPWTTAAGQFPMDIMIGGERIRLSGIAAPSASSPPLTQVFTVASGGRAINGVAKAHSAGAAISLFRDVYNGH
jgi:hypothetical protein